MRGSLALVLICLLVVGLFALKYRDSGAGSVTAAPANVTDSQSDGTGTRRHTESGPDSPGPIHSGDDAIAVGAAPAKGTGQAGDFDGLVNIGEERDADAPLVHDGGMGEVINIGPYLDASDPVQGRADFDTTSVSVGPVLALDAWENIARSETDEYVDIGPRMHVEETLQASDDVASEPVNIGPAMNVEAESMN